MAQAVQAVVVKGLAAAVTNPLPNNPNCIKSKGAELLRVRLPKQKETFLRLFLYFLEEFALNDAIFFLATARE